jgi:uncharacterized membrane protein
VVLLSGIVEIALGLTLLLWKSKYFGWALAIFFILVLGNLAQYLDGKDALSFKF